MEGVRTHMATDYDSPRKTDDELTEDSLQELQARRMDKSSTTIDVDPDDVAESLELPGADLSNEELSFRVIPRQADEFTCSRCFLVHHRSQLAEDTRRPAGLPRVRGLIGQGREQPGSLPPDSVMMQVIRALSGASARHCGYRGDTASV